jgi:hypothetical protein
MSKPVWACPTCGEDFTRKSSAMRHSSKLHNGRVFPIRYIDYLTGRQSGQYPPPLTPPRLLRSRTKMRSNRSNNHLTVADSSRGEFSLPKDMEFNDDSRYIDQSFARATHQIDPIDETTKLVRQYVEYQSAYNRLNQAHNSWLPSINADSFSSRMSIAKPIGFSGICDLCLSGQIDAVWNFVEDGSLTKIIHACDPEVVMRLKHLDEDKRKAFQYTSLRSLADAVNYWIGHGEVYLKAEELLPTERYDFVTDAKRPPSHEDYIGLGDLKENYWAERAIKEDKRTPMAAGAVTITKDELLDFLSITRATFGIFRVKMPDGGTRDFFMYIVRGLEFCKFNHLKELAAKSSHINNNNTLQQTDLYNVIQFVDGGSILKWDKLDSMSKKNLLGQIQEWSKNHRGYS